MASRSSFRPFAGAAVLSALMLLAASGCVIMSAGVNPFELQEEPLDEKKVSGEGRDKILLMDISNVITGQSREGTFGIARRESTVARVKEQLRKAKKDGRVKALVLRIDSPGGTVTASDMIYYEIMKYKEEAGVPVIASLMDVAASGGYYVALASDRIVAHPTTITGSIGVVLFKVSLEELLDKIGIEDESVKSGSKKDIGSYFRRTTPAERRILQGIIDHLHQRFVEKILESRGDRVEKSALKKVADGRILTAEEAVALHLVDRVGYLDEAIELAKEATGVEKATVVTYHRPDEYRENIYNRLPQTAPLEYDLIRLDLGAWVHGEIPRFMYLWAPGLGSGGRP